MTKHALAWRKAVATALQAGASGLRRLRMVGLIPGFAKVGRNLRFDPRDYFSFHSIEIGDDVYIGPGAYISSAHGRIRIGSMVMFGPNVTILGGNHVSNRVGISMVAADSKQVGDDPDIEIENDVWVGANATILPGVCLGRGSIVAAGAIVTHSVPPYAIVAGVPARLLRHRFTPLEIRAHEIKLYGTVLTETDALAGATVGE